MCLPSMRSCRTRSRHTDSAAPCHGREETGPAVACPASGGSSRKAGEGGGSWSCSRRQDQDQDQDQERPLPPSAPSPALRGKEKRWDVAFSAQRVPRDPAMQRRDTPQQRVSWSPTAMRWGSSSGESEAAMSAMIASDATRFTPRSGASHAGWRRSTPRHSRAHGRTGSCNRSPRSPFSSRGVPPPHRIAHM